MSDSGEESEDEDSQTMGSDELWFAGLLGLLVGYFTLSGSISLLIYLRWLGISRTIADAIEPLSGAAVGVLGVFSVFINFIMMSFLIYNSEQVRALLQRHGV